MDHLKIKLIFPSIRHIYVRQKYCTNFFFKIDHLVFFVVKKYANIFFTFNIGFLCLKIEALIISTIAILIYGLYENTVET